MARTAKSGGYIEVSVVNQLMAWLSRDMLVAAYQEARKSWLGARQAEASASVCGLPRRRSGVSNKRLPSAAEGRDRPAICGGPSAELHGQAPQLRTPRHRRRDDATARRRRVRQPPATDGCVFNGPRRNLAISRTLIWHLDDVETGLPIPEIDLLAGVLVGLGAVPHQLSCMGALVASRLLSGDRNCPESSDNGRV